jgi:hypothetical protein
MYLVPTTNVEDFYQRVLENYCSIARHELGIQPPYEVEMGAIGLRDVRLGIAMYNISEPIHVPELRLRRVLTDAGPDSVDGLVEEFLVELFDLAGETRPQRR